MTHIRPGELVCNYASDFYLGSEAVNHVKTTVNSEYLLHGKHNSIRWCMDAWSEDDYGNTTGRLINHSKKHANLVLDFYPATDQTNITVAFRAIQPTRPGDELLWDYGDERSGLEAWYNTCPCWKCLPLGDTFQENNAPMVRKRKRASSVDS